MQRKTDDARGLLERMTEATEWLGVGGRRRVGVQKERRMNTVHTVYCIMLYTT